MRSLRTGLKLVGSDLGPPCRLTMNREQSCCMVAKGNFRQAVLYEIRLKTLFTLHGLDLIAVVNLEETALLSPEHTVLQMR